MSNYIDEEDVKILMEQGNISREESKKLLKKYLGDIVECLLHVNKYIENKKGREKELEDKISEVKINDENLLNYRNIIDEKEKIYNTISENKEKNKNKKKVILNNEEIYYSCIKGNFTSIRVL